MANKVQHDEEAIEADATGRAAAVIAALIRADPSAGLDTIALAARTITALIRSGALRWSSIAGMPVTGRRDKLTAEVEEWLRHG